MAPPNPVFVLLVPLIAWRIYKRVRRNIGLQRSRLARHWAGTVLCPLLLLLFAAGAMRSMEAEGALAGGILGGIGLGLYGLKLTRFEIRDGTHYYTPNPYLGVGLSLLLVTRVAWRLAVLYQMGGTFAPASGDDLAKSPLTLLMVGVVFGYYATYSLGLLRWRQRTKGVAAV